jgi:mono/diheme cytochrome c family protein
MISVAPAPCLRIASGQDTPDYFRQNCMNCHTIGGGRLTGPDLKDVTQRQDRAWLADFITNPRSVLDSGDPYARKIFEESRNVPMPVPPGITKERAEKLLDLIEAESALEESQFRGLQISTVPFMDEDRSRGRQIFLGRQRLAEGGTSCISCHSIHDLQPLGGGQLGPDLTNVFERLKGRMSLSAWLVAPGTETMQPAFKNHPLSSDEIHALVAYFESTAAESPSSASVNRVAFLLIGLAGATLWVFLFDVIWKRRFHAVRRPLVESLPSRGIS